MFGGTRGRLVASVCAAAALGGIAGCGDSDEESTAGNAATTFSRASEPPKTFIERMAKLLETTTAAKDCAQLEEINQRSPSRFSCPPAKALRKSMASFEVVGVEEYGTGAVVDYKSGKLDDGAAILLFVSPDRNWGIGRFGVVTKPSTETSDEDSREGYDEAVDRYLTAVRERNCKAFEKVAFTGGVKRKDVCKVSLAATKPLAKRLKANPSAAPSYAGGNATYGFYNLETRKPEAENSTISVVKSTDDEGASYVVLDVLPSPTAADQKLIQEQLREQRKQKANDDMTPSSKPSDPAVTTP